MTKKIILLIATGLCFLIGRAQEHGFPVIGEPCPDFVLRNIRNYPVDSVSLADLKGRYVILDFWHRHCVSCLEAFPKNNKLAEKFSDKLTLFTVGLEDKQGLSEFYDVLKARHGLTMPAAVDSELYHRFVAGGAAPHYVGIDDKGIVKAVTGKLMEAQVAAFVAGEPFDFADNSYEGRFLAWEDYDKDKPFLVDGNGGSGYPIRYRSILLDFVRNEMPSRTIYRSSLDDFVATGRNTLEGVMDLKSLYRLAYLGYYTWTNDIRLDSIYLEAYRTPIVETGNPLELEPDPATGRNMYWYSLILPEERFTKENIMAVMQRDLAVNFGYDVRVETRELPYWKVVASESALKRLASKQQERAYQETPNKQTLTAYTIDELLLLLFYKVHSFQPPIINETGYTGKIDMEIHDTLGTDFGVIKRELEKNGIRLEQAKRPFRVVVIRSSE